MLQTLQEPGAYLNPYSPPHKQALLVQQIPSLDESGISLMGAMLESRGYDVSNIGPEACTKERVLASIDELADGSGDASRTLFYYSGHGFPNGIGTATIVDAYPKGIGPYELFAGLGNVRGKKAVFVDSCLSGVFTDYLKDPDGAEPLIRNYVAIASTQRDGLSLLTLWEDIPDGSRLKGSVISNLVHWLYTSHCEYGGIHLDSLPIQRYVISPERVEKELQKFYQMFPWLAVKKVSLEIQRVSDTDFEL